jgi:hypothetical protein
MEKINSINNATMETQNKIEEIHWGKKNELLWIGIAVIIAGLIAKIPQFQGIREDLFYERNVSFIFLPILMIYFNWKKGQVWNNLIVPFIVIALSIIYINWLPSGLKNTTSSLAFFHLPIMVWILLGYVFLGNKMDFFKNGIQYFRYSADLLLMSVIILLSGFLFMAMTMGLFKLIGIDTAFIIQNYILVWGLPAVPIIATFIVQNNPQVVNKISPVIAKIFTPMVTLMLILFLFGIIVTGKNLSKDREFLVVFNALLIGVMALIIFSLSEMSKVGRQPFQLYTLLTLSVITIILNSFALFAIVLRLLEFGLSANRIAVIGADLFIFTHLILVTRKLFLFSKSLVNVSDVEETAGNFLPIYFIWNAFVVFLIPILFGFQ